MSISTSGDIEAAPPAAPRSAPELSNAGLRYRPEIDGLRALAVVPVVLFHAGFAGFSGGFVGVDVFFVISGYLITSLILRDIAEKRFSILGFYERRARRILPAMIFVVICSVPLAAWALLPSGLREFGQSITATMGFYANHYFLSHVDYFAPRAEAMPLLHMWSLAVEEQYYLFLPPALWLLWRFGARPRLLGWGMLAASVVGVIGTSLVVLRWPGVAFFTFPTRAFELGIGSTLGIAMLAGPLPGARAAGEGLAALGVAMILGSVALLPGPFVMPSYMSLVPCLGAAFIIGYARAGTATHRLLAAPPLVGIGLISFSFYLWHQPLFAFARARLGEPAPGLMAGLAALSALLAWGTWRLVEQPARHARMARGRLLALAAAGLFVTGLVGQMVAWQAERLHPLAAADRQLDVSFEDRGAFVRSRYNALPRDFAQSAPGQPRLLIVGDSFSQDFYNMALAAGAFRGWAVATHYIATVCQTYFGTEDVSAFVEPDARRRCRASRDPARVRSVAKDADLIVMVTRWTPWAAERLPESIAAMGLRPDQKVIVLGAKGFGEVLGARYVGWSAAERAAARVSPTDEQNAGNAVLRATFGEDRFVDAEALLCPDGTCPLFTEEGALLSHDGHHLTEIGAAVVGAALFRHPLLAPYLEPAG